VTTGWSTSFSETALTFKPPGAAKPRTKDELNHRDPEITEAESGKTFVFFSVFSVSVANKIDGGGHEDSNRAEARGMENPPERATWRQRVEGSKAR
jgi:hypothetical protein